MTQSDLSKPSNDYARGQRDGLRLALDILATEEAKWALLLGKSDSWRTNLSRDVRHKTFKVARTRLATALNRLTKKDGDDSSGELAAALRKLGL